MLWQCYSHVWAIRWWPVVGGASGHSCSEDRSLFSLKGYRIDRRLKASVGSEVVKGKGGKCTNLGLYLLTWYLILYCCFYLNELTLSVCVWR